MSPKISPNNHHCKFYWSHLLTLVEICTNGIIRGPSLRHLVFSLFCSLHTIREQNIGEDDNDENYKIQANVCPIWMLSYIQPLRPETFFKGERLATREG